jgi:putative transposase
MRDLSQDNPRYGYRRVWALLRREGWEVNKKRVLRLWREQGLKVPRVKQHKSRRLLGGGENGCTRRRAEYPNHLWSYDFAMDSTEDGRRLKVMPVVDEYTRECLSLEAERSIKACRVIDTLGRLFIERGEPDYIRSDRAAPSSSQRRSSNGWRSLWSEDPLHRAWGSVGERLLRETFISRMRLTSCWRGRCSST